MKLLLCSVVGLIALVSFAQATGKKERTLVLIKPEGIQRGHINDIIDRFEIKGFQLVAIEMTKATPEMIEKHYQEHKDKPYFKGMVKYMTSGPVLPMVMEGENAVAAAKAMIGPLDPREALPGTIRGDYSLCIKRNVVDSSDSVEAAEREIKIWFESTEIISWRMAEDHWIDDDED